MNSSHAWLGALLAAAISASCAGRTESGSGVVETPDASQDAIAESEASAGAPNGYQPCVGKACGAVCAPCAPGDSKCTPYGCGGNSRCDYYCDEMGTCAAAARPACLGDRAATYDPCGPSANGKLCTEGLVCCSACRSGDASVDGCGFICQHPCWPGDYQPGICVDLCVHDQP
jgi:hypothetical protein